MNSQTVEAYIANTPAEVQPILEKVRKTIQAAAPEANEKISYGIPTYHQGENLIHFAAAKKHLGIYPTPKAIVHFQKELANYRTSKGTVQFPYDQPIPYDLITKMTKYRVTEATNK